LGFRNRMNFPSEIPFEFELLFLLFFGDGETRPVSVVVVCRGGRFFFVVLVVVVVLLSVVASVADAAAAAEAVIDFFFCFLGANSSFGTMVGGGGGMLPESLLWGEAEAVVVVAVCSLSRVTTTSLLVSADEGAEVEDPLAVDLGDDRGPVRFFFSAAAARVERVSFG